MQLINALGKSWKKSRKEEKVNLITLSVYDHHLIKNKQFLSLNKLSSRELYRFTCCCIKPPQIQNYISFNIKF